MTYYNLKVLIAVEEAQRSSEISSNSVSYVLLRLETLPPIEG